MFHDTGFIFCLRWAYFASRDTCGQEAQTMRTWRLTNFAAVHRSTVKASVILLSRKLFILAMGWCLCLSPVFGEPLERVVGSIWAVGPGLRCFVHFDFEMCFAPLRRALFRHLNCQKWSAPGVLCAFWLRNVLRATTACTFSISQLPKVLRDPGVLYILTCKCASRHNGVQFFISDLASWLRIRRFSEPTFRPSGAPDHWKNTVFQCFATFRPFLASASSFFLLFLFYSSFF